VPKTLIYLFAIVSDNPLVEFSGLQGQCRNGSAVLLASVVEAFVHFSSRLTPRTER